MRRVLVLVVGALLSACAAASADEPRYIWDHDDHNYARANFNRDHYECQRDAAMVPRVPYTAGGGTADQGVYGGGFAGGFQRGFNQAGQSREAGDRDLALGLALAAEARAANLFRACMASKGYRLIPAE
jgi:hypothetical protein